MRLPKFGRTRSIQNRPGYLNMKKLVEWVDKGRLDHTQKIDLFALVQSGLVSRDKAKYGIKLLCKGDIHVLDYALKIELSDASEKAIALIKAHGGTVDCVYRTPLQVEEQINPAKFKYHLQAPLPGKRRIAKLQNIHKRGATVHFEQPQWLIDQGGFEALVSQDQSQEEQRQAEFQYPAQRTPGCGADKIRKRKTVLWKSIDILPDTTTG